MACWHVCETRLCTVKRLKQPQSQPWVRWAQLSLRPQVLRDLQQGDRELSRAGHEPWAVATVGEPVPAAAAAAVHRLPTTNSLWTGGTSS